MHSALLFKYNDNSLVVDALLFEYQTFSPLQKRLQWHKYISVPYCKISHVYMQHIYVHISMSACDFYTNMQLIYVTMRIIYVDVHSTT